MNRVSTVVFAVVISFVLAGCQSTGLTKKNIGAVTGGVLGGLAGHTLGGKNKKLFAIGGAVAGVWLGSQIGKHLEEKDQQEMAESSQKAIMTGEKQTWSNSETNVSGSAEVIEEKDETVDVAIKVQKDRVEIVPPLDMIGEPYTVSKTSNVRGGPGKDYKVLEVISKDTTVDVIGKVQDQPWMLVGFNNTGSGFIHSSLVQPVPVEQRKTEIEPVETQTSETVEQTVAVKRTCKTIKQVIILEDGSEKVEEITACQGPNGWETI